MISQDIALLSIALLVKHGHFYKLIIKTVDKPLGQEALTVSIHATSYKYSQQQQSVETPKTNSLEGVHWPLTRPQIFEAGGFGLK